MEKIFESSGVNSNKNERKYTTEEALVSQEYATKLKGKTEGREVPFSEMSDPESYEEAETLIETLRETLKVMHMDFGNLDIEKIDFSDPVQKDDVRDRLIAAAEKIAFKKKDEQTIDHIAKLKRTLARTTINTMIGLAMYLATGKAPTTPMKRFHDNLEKAKHYTSEVIHPEKNK